MTEFHDTFSEEVESYLKLILNASLIYTPHSKKFLLTNNIVFCRVILEFPVIQEDQDNQDNQVWKVSG